MNGIVTQAWSPLGRANRLLKEPVLRDLAVSVGRSVGQVILRWHHQLRAVPLPKAESPERQSENRAIFDFQLDQDAMTAIAGLARGDGRIADQNPATYEEF